MAHDPRPRLLILTHRRPNPPDRGDRIRSHAWLTGLSPRFHTSLAYADTAEPSKEDQYFIDQHTQRCAHARITDARAQRHASCALLTGRAATPAAFFDRKLRRTLDRWDREQPFHAVLTFCTGMARYTQRLLAARKARDERPPIHVLDLVDVDSRKWARDAADTSLPFHKRWVAKIESQRLVPYEAGRRAPLDHLVVTSPHEANLYKEHIRGVRGDLNPIPIDNGVDLARFPQAPPVASLSPEARQTFLFTGVLDYPPNTRAVERFAKHILPKIQDKYPAARFRIVGRNPPETWKQHESLSGGRGVDLIGPVDNVAHEHHHAAISAAPLDYAPGVQNKVLEAMAVGRAVVCSAGAAQGLDAQPNQHLLTADSDDEFATACIKLLDAPEQSQALGQAARARIAERYDWRTRVDRLAELLTP
ncbi:MAG: glycosyltransferase [Planctomycetota bacterium]